MSLPKTMYMVVVMLPPKAWRINDAPVRFPGGIVAVVPVYSTREEAESEWPGRTVLTISEEE